MSLRYDLARRLPKAWAVRLALAAVVTLLGYYGVIFSVAQVVVGRNPALAYRLAPYDGRITGAYAAALVAVDVTPQDRVDADALAKRALQQAPMAVAALGTLGLNADTRGDTAAARRYFAHAQKLSRRDLRTQLFMIENAVQRGDIPGALHQYDITLRVLPALGDLLYPVLASASTEPAIRRELVKTLAGRPLWSDSFIGFVSSGSDPETTAALFLSLHAGAVPVLRTASARVINALIASGRADAAWPYYAAIHPDADRRRSRDARFAATPEAPSQFDWIAINDGSGLTSSIQSGIFDFAVPASVGGPMLQQVQLLPPGTYRLIGHSLGIKQAGGARPYWMLTCQGGPELGRIEVPNSSVANGNFSGTYIVPASCAVQTLVLIARPSDAASGLSGQFDRVELAQVAK